jgi:nitronate monooxygenase
MELPDRYTSMVRCRLPVQQAPMGSVASVELAVAVAEAGGVGSLTATGRSASSLERVVDELAARTTGVVALNFLTDQIDLDALQVAASGVAVVDFFWSTPAPRPAALAHEGGALVSWQVGSVEEARAAAGAGADVVVVQGTEAGGHVWGHAALLPLLAAVLDVVDVPVLAAGGIGHPRTLAAVLAAGASGARVGTAFIATEESGAHERYKQAVVDAGAGSTTITDAFRTGCPLCATSARHRVLAGCIEAAAGLPEGDAGEVQIGSRTVAVPRGSFMSPTPATTGHVEAMVMYASDAAEAVTAVRPAAEVLTWLCDGAEALLSR